MPNEPKKVTVPWTVAAPERGERLVMVTAYDYPQARTADAAGVDIVLVGDSLAMVVLGHADTLSVTMDEMLHHVKAVRRGVERALLVADMPYGSFHLGPEQAVANALRFVKEGGAQAVKIEGARPDIVRALVAAEVPVMAHLGLTPQSIHRLGGFKVQGRGAEARAAAARGRARARGGGRVLAGARVRARRSSPPRSRRDSRSRPSASAPALDCDGQVLVYHDLLGLEERIAPRFVRRYAELGPRRPRGDRRLRRRRARAGASRRRERELRGSRRPSRPPRTPSASSTAEAAAWRSVRTARRARRLTALASRRRDASRFVPTMGALHDGPPVAGAPGAPRARPRRGRVGLRQPDPVRAARGLRALSRASPSRTPSCSPAPAATSSSCPSVETIYPPGPRHLRRARRRRRAASRASCGPGTSAASPPW